MPFYVEFLENIAFWHLDDGKNLFNVETVTAMHKCLDEIEANSEVTCMISIGYGKNYSQGLDLEKLRKIPEVKKSMKYVFSFFVRVLTFPMPTIAAVNGHAYGAGAFLAVCHDYRIMREDRGYLCFPEAKLGIHFGMEVLNELIRRRIPNSTQSIAILSLPFTAEEALKHGLVQEVLTNLLDQWYSNWGMPALIDSAKYQCYISTYY